MKKVFALVMALVLALSLAACGGGEKKDEYKEKKDEYISKIQEKVEEYTEPTIDPVESAIIGSWKWTSGEASPYGITDIEFYEFSGKAMGEQPVYYITYEVSGNVVTLKNDDNNDDTFHELKLKYENDSLVSVDSRKTTYTKVS